MKRRAEVRNPRLGDVGPRISGREPVFFLCVHATTPIKATEAATARSRTTPSYPGKSGNAGGAVWFSGECDVSRAIPT